MHHHLSAPPLLLPLLLLPLLTTANPAAHHPRAAAAAPSYSTTYLTTPSTVSTTLSPTGPPNVSEGVDVQIVTGWGYPCGGSCTWEAQVPTSTTGSTHTWWKTRVGTSSSWVSVATPPPTTQAAVLAGGGSVETGKPDVGGGKEGGEGEVHCDASGHCSEG